MGSPDPRSFSRNKRGIAGTLIWVNFDRHALLELVRRMAGKFVANIDDVRPQYAFSDQIAQTGPPSCTRSLCTRGRFATLLIHCRLLRILCSA